MRIWSIHPKYFDSKGLVALWRETLLAKSVLFGNTRGYKNHPQLSRFKIMDDPVGRINQYLFHVYTEVESRNYKFNKDKIDADFEDRTMTVTSGQINFERNHLLNKLKIRAPEKFKMLTDVTGFEPHPLFELIEGEIEGWEIV